MCIEKQTVVLSEEQNMEESLQLSSRFKSVCVFCGSSTGKRDSYRDAAIELGQQLVEKRLNLVYGGGSIGLMGLVSQTVHQGGGHVIGIIPKTLMGKELTGETIGELRPVANMHQRKAEMARHSDCFIAPPGPYLIRLNSFRPQAQNVPLQLMVGPNLLTKSQGNGADFTTEGTPIELPESVVLEAYREWEVKVHNWQIQCPTLAHPKNFMLSYWYVKLLPTVGCEADGATFYTSKERRKGGEESNINLAFAFQYTGCYATLWSVEKEVYSVFELEHCLIDPRDKEESGG